MKSMQRTLRKRYVKIKNNHDSNQENSACREKSALLKGHERVSNFDRLYI